MRNSTDANPAKMAEYVVVRADTGLARNRTGRYGKPGGPTSGTGQLRVRINAYNHF